MPKILITADIHWGLPNKNDDILWALNKMQQYAYDNNIDHAFILGDLYHNRQTSDVIEYHRLLDFFQKSEIEWIVFPGNHDLPKESSWDISTISLFHNDITTIKGIKKIQVDGFNYFIWILPYIKDESLYVAVLDEINELASENDILFTHIGINKALFKMCYMDRETGINDLNFTKFKYIIAGHFHNYQQIDNFYYVGSPIPSRFDEGMVSHGFMTLDEQYNLEFINLFEYDDHPPNYITCTVDELDNIDAENNFIRIIISNEEDKLKYEKKIVELRERGAKQIKIQDKIKPNEVTDNIDHNDLFNIIKSYIDDVMQPIDGIDKNTLIEMVREIYD